MEKHGDSAYNGGRVLLPGLTLMKMLLHELSSEVFDQFELLNVWRSDFHISDSSEEAWNTIHNTLMKLWPVALEVFSDDKKAHGSLPKDSGQIAKVFVQCYILSLCAKFCTCAISNTEEIAEETLRHMSKEISAAGEMAEQSVDWMSEGFHVISETVEYCTSNMEKVSGFAAISCFTEVALAYTSALSSLAAVYINRRKLFSLAIRTIFPCSLRVPLIQTVPTTTMGLDYFLFQWCDSIDQLILAALLDEKVVTELAQGYLPDPNRGITSVMDRSSADESLITTQWKRRAGYTSAIYTVIVDAIYEESKQIPTNPPAMYQLQNGFQRVLKSTVDNQRGKRDTGDAYIISVRKACAKILHIGLALVEVCALHVPNESEQNFNDDSTVLVRTRCRMVVLQCLAEKFGITAIPDHPSLAKYSSLIRSLYRVLVGDLTFLSRSKDNDLKVVLTKKRKTENARQFSKKEDIISSLLHSIRCVVAIDHRPILDGYAGENYLGHIIMHLRCSLRGAHGAEALLHTLIEVHHNLRILPSLIKSTFCDFRSVIQNRESQGVDELALLLNSEDEQKYLSKIFVTLPSAQLVACWDALQTGFLDLRLDEKSESSINLNFIMTLQAWIKPLSLPDMGTAAPFDNVWLPLLQKMSVYLRGLDPDISSNEDIQAMENKTGSRKRRRRGSSECDADTNQLPVYFDSILVIVQHLGSLCALLAPYCDEFYSNNTKVSTESQGLVEIKLSDKTSDTWSLVRNIGNEILTILSNKQSSFWYNAPNLRVADNSNSITYYSNGLSCGLSIFSLLATIETVKLDEEYVFSPDLLLDLLHVFCFNEGVKGFNTSNQAISVLLLHNLSVWSHLFCTDSVCKSNKLDAIVTKCTRDIAFSVKNSYSTKDTTYDTLLRILNSAPFLENRRLVQSFCEQITSSILICGADGSVMYDESICNMLLEMPQDFLSICLNLKAEVPETLKIVTRKSKTSEIAERTTLDVLNKIVVKLILDGSNCGNVVHVLMSYYSSLQIDDSTSAVFISVAHQYLEVISVQKFSIPHYFTGLVLMILDSCFKSGKVSELRNIIIFITRSLDWRRYFVVEPTNAIKKRISKTPAATRKKKVQEDCRAFIINDHYSSMTLIYIQCMSNGLVELVGSKHISDWDEGSALFGSFIHLVESYLGATISFIDEYTSQGKDKLAVEGLLKICETLTYCARAVASILNENIELEVKPLFVSLLDRVGLVMTLLIGAKDRLNGNLVLKENETDCAVSFERILIIFGSLSLMTCASGGDSQILTKLPANDILHYILRMSVRYCDCVDERSNFNNTLSSYRVACRGLLLCIHDIETVREVIIFFEEVLISCARSGQYHNGNTIAAFTLVFTECVILSALEYPNRRDSKCGMKKSAGVSDLVLHVCSLVQANIPRFTSPSARYGIRQCCSSKIDIVSVVLSLHHILVALQHYQRNRSTNVDKKNIRGSISKNKDAVTLNDKFQDILDIMFRMISHVTSEWLSTINPYDALATNDNRISFNSLFVFIEKILLVIEMTSSLSSDSLLNTSVGAISLVLRKVVTVLCMAVRGLQNEQIIVSSESEFHIPVNNAIRQCSRLFAWLASSRPLYKYVHLLGASIVDILAAFPSVCNTATIQGSVTMSGGHGANLNVTVDILPLVSGLFCMFDKCKSTKQRMQMFAALGVKSPGISGSVTDARFLMNDLHETYMREYKFVGMA